MLVIISVQGCSTWRRGLSSRKYTSLEMQSYKYSTVPALTYPTSLAKLTAFLNRKRENYYASSKSTLGLVKRPLSFFYTHVKFYLRTYKKLTFFHSQMLSKFFEHKQQKPPKHSGNARKTFESAYK